VGGVYVLFGVGTYAELATMLPKAGGSYNYIKLAFGRYWGFVTGWFDYIANAIAPAFFCIVIGEYIVKLFPALQQFSTIIAVAFLVGFVLLHATGVRSGSIMQQITSVVKVFLFVVLIVTCFMYSGVTTTPLNQSPKLVELSVVISFFKALQLVFGTYNGWAAGSYFAEEDKNPGKNIPKSMYRGALVLIIIYTLINIAFFSVLPVQALAGKELAAADVATQIFGTRGGTIVTIISLFSIVSILNAYMMIPSRILFGLSRDGFFVPKGALVNKGGTPIVSLVISGFFALILLLIGSFEMLFTLSSSFSIIVWGMAYAALIKLRKSEPDLPRPYKSWGYPFTSVFMVLFSVALLIGIILSDKVSLISVLIALTISYPIFQGIQKAATKIK
jgi:APA family basic amino acid/polyamine antiporter